MLRLGTRYALALAALRMTSAIPTIAIKGSKFFTSDGDQFYIKGVAYQNQNVTNSLTNSTQCSIDAKLIAQLGANVIRVYSIDPTLTVTSCMNAFADAGIYVLVDMTTPTYFIDRTDPKWTMDLRNQFAKVLDGLHQYDNLLGFFAGNEVVRDVNSTIAAPVVKAVIADMKAYRDAMQYRKIPIGYSNNAESIIDTMADFMDCGNSNVAADFFGFNRYSWCGDSSMAASGYNQLYAFADGFDIPIFLSEDGCNIPSPRQFTDQPAVLGREMNDRFSGALMYEWIEDTTNYGLVSYSNDAATGTPSLLADYANLASQWSTLSPAGVQATTYSPTLTKRACPAYSSSSWLVQAAEGTSLPTLGLSGFTTPTASASASASASRSGSGGPPTAGSSTSTPASKKSSTPIGAIVGGVIGGLAVLLILIALLLYRRKRKARNAPPTTTTDPHSDKITTTGAHDPTKSGGYYDPPFPQLQGNPQHELAGAGTTQELDPNKGTTTAFAASELPPDTRTGELGEYGHGYDYGHGVGNDYGGGYGSAGGYAPVRSEGGMNAHSPGQERGGGNAPGQETGGMVAPVTEPSANVQAQRRREMEWLESEEARMREQRERLMRQN